MKDIAMRNYQDVIKELKSHNIKPYIDDFGEGGYYDYSYLRLEPYFQEFFLFGQEYLDKKHLGFNISPARFFFNDHSSINARAKKNNTYSLVEIFKGAFVGLHDFYLSKNEIFDLDDLKHFKIITESKPCFFLFQFVSNYFFYHEVGHLIQFNTIGECYVEFINHNCNEEEISVNHMKEFDADWFSATELVKHIIDYVKKLSNNKEKINYNVLLETSGLVLGGIYAYYINRSAKQSKIYFQDKCHPHPLVRLRYMFEFFLENIHDNVPNGIDMGAIIKIALKVSEALLMDNNKNIAKQYSDILLEEMNNINRYIDKIKRDVAICPTLCINILKSN